MLTVLLPVVIQLTVLESSVSTRVPKRRICLSGDKARVPIGRASKRNSLFHAAEHNAWFDSAVMSRSHAELKLGLDDQVSFILLIFTPRGKPG